MDPALVIGLGVGVGVSLFAWLTGLDRDRGFYPTVLIVVAFYYVLFAAMGSPAAMGAELAIAAGFTAAAVIGLRSSLWLLVAGLAGHGLLDLFHGHLVANPGVPVWWPAFCAAADIALAAALALRLRAPRALAPNKPGV